MLGTIGAPEPVWGILGPFMLDAFVVAEPVLGIWPLIRVLSKDELWFKGILLHNLLEVKAHKVSFP